MEGNKHTPMQIATIKDLDASGAYAKIVVQMKGGTVVFVKHDDIAHKIK
jgi:hypothetical protein